MKKNYFLVTVLLLMFSASFTSCDSEPVDTQLVDTENTPGPGNNNGNDGSGSDTTGSYWPMAVNNKWIYNTGLQEDFTMKIIGTQNINGNTYYKYENFIASVSSFPEGLSGTATNYTRKDNNSYKVMTTFEMSTGEGGPSMILSPLEYTLLKDNLAVGQSWEEDVQQTITITMEGMEPITTSTPIHSKCTIMEKSETAVIDGVTYNDVIKVKFEQSASPGSVDATSYYWFIRNKGLMKVQVDFAQSNNSDVIYKIESYTIN